MYIFVPELVVAEAAAELVAAVLVDAAAVLAAVLVVAVVVDAAVSVVLAAQAPRARIMTIARSRAMIFFILKPPFFY